jgi:thymidylate kinase
MIIVLEGCDGAGKTTLAENLVKEAERRGWEGEVWHRGVPVRHPLEEYELDLEVDYPRTADERARRLIVADRWHLGQLVYGPLYRKDLKDFDTGSAWHVDALLQSLGAVQLIVQPDPDLIKRRLKIRGEDYLQEGHIDYVISAYERQAALWNKSTGVLTTVPTDDDVRQLIDWAECRSARADALIPFTTYVGPRYPDLLLLGERHHNGRRSEMESAKHHRAAFVPYSATSGRWLANAIIESPLKDKAIGLANAGQEDVEKLIDTLDATGNMQIVTLGNAASKILDDLGIEHGAAPHPQYMRRFHYSSGPDYAAAILEVADSKRKVWP